MRRRRGIMGLNGGGIPIIAATATGNPLSFITDMVRPLKSLEIPFTPIQSGSGNPSPTNVRPISGWTGTNVYNETAYDANATPKLTINWQTEAGTVYGGTLTLNEDGSADLFISHKAMNLGSLSWRKETTGSPTHTFRTNSTCENYGIATFVSDNWNVCSCFVAQTSRTGNINLSQWRNETSFNNYIGTGGAWPNIYIYAKPVGITTLEAFSALIQDQILICKLITPATYHFDNVGQLITIIGTNTIWTDTNGTNTATYLKHQS